MECFIAKSSADSSQDVLLIVHHMFYIEMMIEPLNDSKAPDACAASADRCFEGNMIAADVARGVGRLFYRHGLVMLCEVSLPNGRRADLVAMDARGEIVIVEIKVSRADLLGDSKWPDYLDFCDRFFWALPAGFDYSPLEAQAYMPERSGIIIADRYDAEILRPAATHSLAPARRKAETLRLARLAMQRTMYSSDNELVRLPLG